MLFPTADRPATTELVPVTPLTVVGKLTESPDPRFQTEGDALTRYDVNKAVVPLLSARVMMEMLFPVGGLHNKGMDF